jgi:Na+/H+-dicarboxylate symporter
MNGMIALRTLVYFLLTSLVSSLLGLLLVITIHPGTPQTKLLLGAGMQQGFLAGPLVITIHPGTPQTKLLLGAGTQQGFLAVVSW